mgnify:CR=1 FL=1
MKCDFCGQEDETVEERPCGFTMEINGVERLETICDSCEHQHLMDI